MPHEKVVSIRREPSDALLQQLSSYVDPYFNFNNGPGRELICQIAVELLERRRTMFEMELRATAMMKKIDGAMQVTPCPR